MEVIRYKYIFLLTILVQLNTVSTANKNGNAQEKTHNCPFTRIIEDIFKINNKTSDVGIFIKDTERNKLFLNSITNITSTENNTSKLIQEELVNDIIASIKRIKENITAEESSKESSLNEAIILNVPERHLNSNNKIKESNKKVVTQIKSGMEEKTDVQIPKNLTTKVNINKRDDAVQLDDTKNIKNDLNKTEYVEILTVEPNNTTINNSSSNKILEVLKKIMPMLNTSITKELHSVTIIESNQNKNQTFSETKNISTVVVKYCDKSNITLSDDKLNANPKKDNISDTISYKEFYIETDNNDYGDGYEKKLESNVTAGGYKNVLEAAEYGMQKMHELYAVLEPKLYSMGLWLNDKDPARYVAAFNAPSEEVARYSRYGYATLQAAEKLKQLDGADREDGLESRTEEVVFPAATALRQSPLLEECPLKGTPKCPPASKRYRTHDGTCNNLSRLRWGSTMTPVQRFLPPVYSDGIQAPRRSVFGSLLPSAREISALIHEDHNVENQGITHLLMQWGQFLDHDVTSSSQSRGFNGSVPRCCKDGGRDFIPKEFLHPECMPIAVPQSDPFYGPRGVRCLDFIRSSPAPRDDCAIGWREQMNQVSAYIDGSPLYASSARQSDKLRLFRNGMLQYGRVQQRRPLLPREHRDELCRGGAVSTDCFKSGDGRVNEHPGLVAAHIVWLRQHNRMAQELAHLNPHWSDEKIYQETRKIVGAMLQHITYREFLPIVLGSEVMRLFELEPLKKGYYKNYDPKVNPSPASSFGSAAFRFGHSLVQASMVRFDRFHRPLSNNVSLHDELTNPSNIWSMGAVDRLLLGMVNQPSQRRDEFITQELTNHLFQTPHFDFGMDLAAINIQRGRDHGVPAYTSWREPCGLSAIVNFDDLMRVMPMRVVRKLKLLYRHVDDIDLFTGGMAERPVVGGLVGPTFACIIAQQFANLRKGDRFWYENGGFESSFTPAQLQQIRRISLAQVLCRTLDTIDSVQPFVFLSATNPDNERISCHNGLLNNFDLSPWVEIHLDSNNIDRKSDDDELITENSKPPKSTTTVKPSTKKPSKAPIPTHKLIQKKPSPDSNSTKATNHEKLNKTETTVTDKDNINNNKTYTKTNSTKTNVTKPTATQPIDDKLDFKNKSRRYDFESERRFTRPAQYNDYDDEVQSVQSVVINNLQNKRPYNRPYITVTENVDKYTYLINYVPRPTQTWRPTTRRNYDRDVVKVTYQNYDDTYRRPNRPYYNRHENDNDDVDSRNSRPTQLTDLESRSDDEATTTTKAQQTTETPKIISTTENLYKLITFGYIGTYRGDPNQDKLKSDSLTKPVPLTKTDTLAKTDTRTKTDTVNKTNTLTKTDTMAKTDTLTNTDSMTETDLMTKAESMTKTESMTKPDSLTKTDTPTKTDTLTKTDMLTKPESLTKYDTISKDFNTYETKTSITETDDNDDATGKLSTFILYDSVTKPYNIRRRHDEQIHSKVNKYYYLGNVLHKYPDNDTNTTKSDLNDKKVEIVKKNSTKLTEENLQERSVSDKIESFEDIEPKAADPDKNRPKVKKPSGPAKTPSVAFQIIPSENSPSQWAVYDEKEDLPEGLPHMMPMINVDPYALREIPRPMDLNIKRRPGRI